MHRRRKLGKILESQFQARQKHETNFVCLVGCVNIIICSKSKSNYKSIQQLRPSRSLMVVGVAHCGQGYHRRSTKATDDLIGDTLLIFDVQGELLQIGGPFLFEKQSKKKKWKKPECRRETYSPIHTYDLKPIIRNKNKNGG